LNKSKEYLSFLQIRSAALPVRALVYVEQN